MGTSILPGLGQQAAFSDQMFNSIHQMFGPASNASGGNAGGLTNINTLTGGPSALTTGVGSLTGTAGANPGNTNQFYPNQSLLQTTGPNLISAGGGVLNAGLGASGLGLQTLQGPQNFYEQLLSGNPAAVTQALAPTATNLAPIYAGATNQASQGLPVGGFRAAELANLPFAQAQQVGNAALGLQPAAAQALAGLGGEQAQIGQGLAGTGLGLSGQGLSAIQAAMQGALGKQQVNQQAGSVFGDIMQALGVAGNVAGGIGGLLGGLGGGVSDVPGGPFGASSPGLGNYQFGFGL